MSNFAPLVTVVIAFYNEENFLEEAVESVINQSYTNWELILVDDGSTDRSTEFAITCARHKNYRIRYYDHPDHVNKGLSPSRNHGISKASGDYVAFLDADDVWEKQKLQTQIELVQSHPQATVFVEASLYWSSWNNSREDKVKFIGVPGNRVYVPPTLALQLYPLSKGVSPCPSSILIKRSVLHEVNGFEESFTGMYSLFEDQAFLFKVYLSQKVYVSSACNIRYRQRPGSIIQVAKANNHKLFVLGYFLKWAMSYFKKHSIESDAIKSLLEKALLSYYRQLISYKWQKVKRQIRYKLSLH